MGTYSYLVRIDTKSMYNLGKSFWHEDFEIFQVPKSINLLSEDPYEEEQWIRLVQFSDRELLWLTILNHFNESEVSSDLEYMRFIIDGILSFSETNNVFLLNDNFETYFELKREYGFKVTASIYLNDTFE